VRSLPLLENFHASVQLARAAPDEAADDLRTRVRRHLDEEEELVIDPRFFSALQARFPAIAEVRVIPRRGTFANELTRFRYDVLLTVGPRAEARAGCEWLDWREAKLTLPALRALLAERRPELLAIRGVPNPRVHPSAELVRRLEGAKGSVAELRQELAAAPLADGADPEELWQLGEETGHRIDLDWSRHGPDGAFDLVVRRCDPGENPRRPWPHVATPPSEVLPWAAYVNGAARRRARKLLPKLRAALTEKLPDYMVPSTFVFLDALPLTPNGKVDRKALPAPDSSRRVLASAYVAPRNAVEEVVAGIWAEALGVDQVGVFDDFFALGGHSLLSTRIVSRLGDAFQVKVPLHRVFSDPTVAGLASALLGLASNREVIEKTAEVMVRMAGLSDEQVEQSLGGQNRGAA
jgi:hypothetical protein